MDFLLVGLRVQRQNSDFISGRAKVWTIFFQLFKNKNYTEIPNKINTDK